MTDIDRLPPHSPDAELATLGSIMIDPDAIFEVSSYLQPLDFYLVKNRWIYEAMLYLSGKKEPIDLVTVSERLRTKEQIDDIGGESFVIGLINAVPTSININHYAKIVADSGVRRRMIAAAGTIANTTFDETITTDELVDKSHKLLFGVTDEQQDGGLVSIKNITSELITDVQEASLSETKPGLKTGFTDLDFLLRGLQKTDYIIVAGRPSMGKTALVNGIVIHAALKNKKRVAMFSPEMSSEKIARRMLSSETRIESSKLRDGDLEERDWPVFMETAGRLSEARLFIDDSASITPMQMRAKCHKVVAQHGPLDLITIDYLQLMNGDRSTSNRVQEVSEISRALNGLAKEFDCPLVALSQLSRAVEQRQDKRPILADLRDSGSLEQDADIVIFVYRDEYYNKDSSERPNIAELSIAKSREGPTGTVDLYWNGRLATFRNLQKEIVDLNSLGFIATTAQKGGY